MTYNSLAKAYMSLRRSNNDLRITSNTPPSSAAFTLLAIVRNELYFLPAFLAHYCRLGVERFIFLDDNSRDGTTEYLHHQPDTVIVESNNSYADPVPVPSSLSHLVQPLRMMTLWRSLLHDIFADEQWALQVDLDEFIHLPAGLTFRDVTRQLDGEHKRAAWGNMLDVYPATVHDLRQLAHRDRLDKADPWYFDGVPHLALRPGRRPRLLHPGAQARLYHTHKVTRLYGQFGIAKPRPIRNPMRSLGITRQPPRYNTLCKPVLLRWSTRDNSYFVSSHETNLIASHNLLLPIQHFRFAGETYRKIAASVQERTHYNNSADYRLMAELLHHMELNGGTFMYSMSRPLKTFHDLTSTGNAVGL